MLQTKLLYHGIYNVHHSHTQSCDLTCEFMNHPAQPPHTQLTHQVVALVAMHITASHPSPVLNKSAPLSRHSHEHCIGNTCDKEDLYKAALGQLARPSTS